MAQGLFDALAALQRQQRQEDMDELSEDRFAAQGGADQARALSAYQMSRMAGKGLGQATAALSGRDPRTTREQQMDALEKAKADMAGMGEHDLSTAAGVDAYYKKVIEVLRKNGLPGEAHAAAQEWNKERNALTDRQLKADDLTRKQNADTEKAAQARRKLELDAERNRIMAERGAGEFVGWIKRIEETDDPRTKQMLIDRANAEIESKKKGIVLENAGDRIIVRDKASGALLGTDAVGEKPESAKDRKKGEAADRQLASAYQADMLDMQTTYKAAVDLYNTPGLDDLIGKWTGIPAEQGPEKGGLVREIFLGRLSPEGQEALGLFQQVSGATFIKAIRDLKAASPKTNSTGLGAVSEVEGNKIQVAKAALFPRQQPASFRRKLAAFIDTIEASSEILAGKAQEDGIDPIPLNVIPLTGPVRGKAPAEAPTRPAAPAPKQSGEPTVMMKHKDTGVERPIFRSKIKEAEAKGYRLKGQ